MDSSCVPGEATILGASRDMATGANSTGDVSAGDMPADDWANESVVVAKQLSVPASSATIVRRREDRERLGRCSTTGSDVGKTYTNCYRTFLGQKLTGKTNGNRLEGRPSD